MTEEQKALAPLQQAGNLMSGSQFQQMLAVSEFLAKSDLIPAHFRGKAANVFVALEMALRQNMSAFMVMQNLYVVHGKPGMEAKLVIALVNQNGGYDGELQYEITRENGKIASCTAWTTRAGKRIDGPPVTAAMVKGEEWIKNQKWVTMEELMYRYRAATFFARVNCPQVLMGLQTSEELQDVVEMTQGTGNGELTFFQTMPQEEVEAGQDVFAALVQSREANQVKVDEFVTHCAEVYKMSPEEIKAKASVNPDNFFGAFEKWVEKQPEKKGRGKAKKPSEPQEGAKEPDPKAEHQPHTPDIASPDPKKANKEQVTRIKELSANLGHSLDAICQDYRVATVEDLSPADAVSLITWLKNQGNPQGQE